MLLKEKCILNIKEMVAYLSLDLVGTFGQEEWEPGVRRNRPNQSLDMVR